MLSDPVAEAFGLIHRHPSGENFWHGMAAVSLEIKGGKELFFHALTFVWEVCTLVPCLLHALGERSFISVQIKSSLTALVIVRS